MEPEESEWYVRDARERRPGLVEFLLGCACGATLALTIQAALPGSREYRIALHEGLGIHEARELLGQPDSFASNTLQGRRTEVIRYGPFAAKTKDGHVTKHRLTLTFVGGYLVEWESAEPEAK